MGCVGGSGSITLVVFSYIVLFCDHCEWKKQKETGEKDVVG
jgi:hypothetical protein